MSEAPSEIRPGYRIANRYRVERLLGKGGMAAVYEVLDETKQSLVAMKRLLPHGARARTIALLFQREYSTLAQLEHPLIIRAFDYGVDRAAPYYTMELVRGENLRALAPLPWQETCSLARDVASALGLVHSRRLIHRDVTPRNVCRTADGRAKLLDFGALAPMGEPRDIAGTPPFLPPENLDGQPLDARSDLFSLGAVLYFLLTGRHAFPATRLSELRQVWNRVVEPPSGVSAGVPESLDALVLSLLSLNPLARPINAAEVFDRLTAIAGLPQGEAPEVARAYLVTPTLVGRDNALARFRRRLLRAERRRGGTIVVEGAGGSGRSRLLSSFLREANLRGMLSVRAEGGEREGEPLGVARSLARRILESEYFVDGALPCPVPLDGALPSEVEPTPSGDGIGQGIFSDSVRLLTDWFLAASEKAKLVIGVDDSDRCDEASSAVLARLSGDASSRDLLVIVTSDGAGSGAVDRLRAFGTTIVLRPLRAAETSELLSSVFGDAPHIEGVAEWIHRLAGGNPGISLELAQHLVDLGVARYEGGRWVLPATLDGLDLPKSLDQALQDRVEALGPEARSLAETLAFTVEHGPLSITEYPALLDDGDFGALFGALNELVAASVLVEADATYAFSSDTMKEVVRRNVPQARRTEIHRRLARAFDSGSGGSKVLSGHHLWEAGDSERAFVAVSDFISDRTAHFVRAGGFIRSKEGARLYERLFEWGSENGAEPERVALLARGVLQLAAVTDCQLARHGPKILDRLRRDSGAVYWDDFPDIKDPLERIRSAIGEAFRRYAETKESERGLEPLRAVNELATSTALLVGVYARTADAKGAAELSRIIEPLRPLSPAVAVVADTIAYAERALTGRAARDLKLSVIEQVKGPVAGIDEVTRVGIGLITRYFLGLEEATLGLPTAVERVAALQGHPSYEPLAWQVRVMDELYRGAQKQADLSRRKRDFALTGRLDVDRHLETSVLYETVAYSLLGDLLELKRILPALEDQAKEWPGWVPYYRLALGSCCSIRGDLTKALEEFEEGLRSMDGPFSHVAWPSLIARSIRTLSDLGRSEEACWRANDALRQCERRGLTPLYVDLMEAMLALGEARVDHAESAVVRARRVVERAEERGTAGIVLCELIEAWARAAFAIGDRNTFEMAAKRIAKMCAETESASFAAKHAALLQLSQAASFETVTVLRGALVNVNTVPTTLIPDVLTEIEHCAGPRERAQRILQELLERSSSDIGFLYLQKAEGFTFAASSPDLPPPPEIDERVAEWVRASLETLDTSTVNTAQVDSTRAELGSRGFEVVGIFTELENESFVAGVAALGARGRRPRPIANAVLHALGQVLIDAGDVKSRARGAEI